VGFTLNWVHTPGPARMDGCYTHTPRGDRNHCSETVQAVAGIALLDDGFEDAAERAFLPTLLARIEPLAIACPPLTYDDSPCPTGRIRCPAEFVHADGRVMPLDPFGQTCPWESDPDVFAAVCSFRDQPCDNGLAEPPEPGTYRGTGRPGYSLTWGTTPTAGSFRCTEERVNRFGGTIWSSGTHRASVAFFPDDTISSGIESVALADGRAQAEMRAAMCP